MKEINELWPELEWIQDLDLREKTGKTWELALEKSVLNRCRSAENSLYPSGRSRS